MREIIIEVPDRFGKTLQPEKVNSDIKGELVRCKDCKHGSLYCTEDVCGATLIECNHTNLGETIAIHKWDWFCADGERRK